MITIRIYNTFKLGIFNTKSFVTTKSGLIVNSTCMKNPENTDFGIFENTIKFFPASRGINSLYMKYKLHLLNNEEESTL